MQKPYKLNTDNSKDKPLLTVKSPCVRNCCLDLDDICLGCFRHLDEITGWQAFSNEEKNAVVLHCQKRRILASKNED